MRPDRCSARRADRLAGSRALALFAVIGGATVSSARAQGTPSNAGALFLEFPVGARAVGMGRAAFADGGTGEAAFWNPAGLAALPAASFELHTVSLAAGRTSAVTAHFPSSRIGVFGGAVYLVDYGDLERTDSSNTTIARISPRNLELLASFATALPGLLSLGISYKLVMFQVDCSGDCTGLPNGDGVTHAVDAGLQFGVGRQDALTIGVAIRNVGFALQVENRDQADPLPTSVGVGALWQTNLGPAEREHFDLRVAADVDRPWTGETSPGVRFGLDVGYRSVARVRAGYGVASGGTASASVGLGVASGAIGVDLAQTFLNESELESANPTFFSFRVSF